MADLRSDTPQPGVRVLILTRAEKRNALSRGLIAALQDRLLEAEAEGIRALVIAGEGPVFSAGADFADLEGDASDEAFDAAMSGLTAVLRNSRIISFAAIDGACVGAGLDLALACDFRVAGPGAGFSLPAAKMGILYNPRRLAQILPMLSHAAALRLLLLAERLDRDEALAGGLATHAAGEGGTLETAVALAGRAAALPPLAQAAAKEFVAAFRAADFDAADWQARRMDLLASDERREALRKAREPKT